MRRQTTQPGSNRPAASRNRRLIGFVVAAFLTAGMPAAAVEDGRCQVKGEILIGELSLPRTVSALKAHRRLSIVAIGSSSTQGYGASEPRQSYPAQLAAMLKSHFPRSMIVVRNKGVGGDDVDNMVARFPKDVFAEMPDLVIWQTGTNDAINHVPLDRFTALIESGVAQLKRHKIDVILMTPQYAPQFTDVVGYGNYLAAMRQAAKASHVPIFDRFFPSMAWLADKHFADSPVLTKDGLHQTDSGYHCVAVLLADRLAGLVASGK